MWFFYIFPSICYCLESIMNTKGGCFMKTTTCHQCAFVNIRVSGLHTCSCSAVPKTITFVITQTHAPGTQFMVKRLPGVNHFLEYILHFFLMSFVMSGIQKHLLWIYIIYVHDNLFKWIIRLHTLFIITKLPLLERKLYFTFPTQWVFLCATYM